MTILTAPIITPSISIKISEDYLSVMRSCRYLNRYVTSHLAPRPRTNINNTQ